MRSDGQDAGRIRRGERRDAAGTCEQLLICRSRAAGFDLHLVKPFDHAELLRPWRARARRRNRLEGLAKTLVCYLPSVLVTAVNAFVALGQPA